MFRLVEETSTLQIENNLIRARQIKDSWFSLAFNIITFSLVIGGFIYFLYSSYNPQNIDKEKLQNIPFQSNTWHNAVKNVPSYEQYGQDPKTEIGSSVQGFINRSSASIF
jgi:hypothetical protein